ncbi:MAG: hypothetical protein GTN82_15630, partial [Candidatus Aminicenantes bacterium]|nr:hypothetical protein [Candidatus Aminicenantes bacterium]
VKIDELAGEAYIEVDGKRVKLFNMNICGDWTFGQGLVDALNDAITRHPPGDLTVTWEEMEAALNTLAGTEDMDEPILWCGCEDGPYN